VPAENGGSGHTEAHPGVGELVPMKFGPQGPVVELAASGPQPASPVAVRLPAPEFSLAGVSDSPSTLSILGRGIFNFLNGSAIPAAVSSLFVSQNDAAFVSQSVPPVMQPGHSYSVSVTMHNSGGTTWDAAQNYRLGSHNPQDNNTWGTGRVYLGGAVAPGTDATFSFQITAPSAPGIYNFQWQMVQDGVEWFGAPSEDLAINVTSDGTYTPATPDSVMISEFRLRGPYGTDDEYVELYNATTQPITVGTADGSRGWALVSSDGVVRFVVPAGTVIPARGHYLATDQAYSLSSYAAPDLTYASDIPDNSGIALFRTAQTANFILANRLDAVGFTTVTDPLYREGGGLAPVATNVLPGDGQFAFYRNLASGLPSDSNSNEDNFVLVSTTGCVGPVSGTPAACAGTTSALGAPNPENVHSPVQMNSTVKAYLLDPRVASNSSPNQERAATVGPNAPSGTLVLRRRYQNNTGAMVTRLRFHVVDMTTLNYGAGLTGPADLRLLSSPQATVTLSDGTGAPVEAVIIDEPPTQGLGGGRNATISVPSVSLATPIAPGSSVNIQFVLGVVALGNFRFFVNVEGDTDQSGQAAAPSADALAAARLDPANRTGGSGVDLRSGNYNWTLPLLSLPGRAGLDLGLSLSYNSRVWTKSGSYVAFDADNGTPSPGFRLGFPAVQPRFYDSNTGKYAYLLIAPGGDHVELRQTNTAGTYESDDSSHLQLVEGGGVLTLLPADGSRMLYSLSGGEYHCTRVTDRNGNYLSASYDGLGNLLNITDTLGRVVTFNYDQYGNLSYISRPVWNPQTHQSEQRQWATFGWDDLNVQTNFAGLATAGVQNGWTIPVLTQVGLPDGSLYRFDYTPWAQVTRISRYTPSSDTPPQNLVFPTDYVQRSSTYYGVRGDGGAETDCPRVTNTSETAENWIGGAQAITWYSDGGDESAGVWGEASMPDQTRYRETYGAAWKRGLVVKAESFAGAAASTLRKTVTTGWTQDNENLGYELNPRPTQTEIADSDGNHRLTAVEYDTSEFKLPLNVREYDKDETTVLRRTNTTYVTDPAYVGRRIIGLPSVVSVFDGGDALVSKTDYLYDQPDEQNTLYLQAADPGDPSGWTPTHEDSYGLSFRAGRANLNVVRQWDVTDGTTAANSALSHKTKVGYDTYGSAIFREDAEGHRTTVSYTDSFSVSSYNAGRLFAYPTTVTDADGYSSKATYDFDFGVVTQAQSPMPNQTAAGVYGPTVTMTYDSVGRPVQVNNSSNAAQTRTVYPASLTSVATYTSIQDEGMPLEEAYASQTFDGAGRVLGSSRNMATAGRYSGRQFVYDSMGRLYQQSNPTEMTGNWVPAGDDASPSGEWTLSQQQYDWKGRPTVTTNQDGTQKILSYGGCGCAGGEIVTAMDEVGRTQKIYHDVLGRVVKTEVLNQDAVQSVYSATTIKYGALDQVTRRRVYEGGAPSQEDPAVGGGDSSGGLGYGGGDDIPGGGGLTTNAYREWNFEYDGYGRLRREHGPEQQDSESNPLWTNYSYNGDDTISTVTDARGAVTTLGYNARHLQISRSSEFGGSTVAVTYGYDAAGNRTSMTDAQGSATYSFDALSRLQSETRAVSALGRSYTISYGYTVAGQLQSVTDPFDAQFTYGHDQAGQLQSVTGSSYAGVTNYASSLTYRAWGGVKSASFGDGSGETVTYDARLQPWQFRLTSNAQGYGALREDFGYYADGRLHTVTDLDDGPGATPPSSYRFMSRTYGYDHAGRVTSAGGVSNTSPYSQSYSYNAFDDLTGRAGSYGYSPGQSDTATYTNGRRDGWTYDPDGRLRVSPANPSSNGRTWQYDAAGQLTTTTETAGTVTTTLTDAYDGDGQLAYESVTGGTSPATYYVLRSSVLGGEVLTRLDQTGEKAITYVPGAGVVSPRQTKDANNQPSVEWTHRDPLGVTEAGQPGLAAYDPLGNYAPLPVAPQRDGGGQPPPPMPPHWPAYSGAGSSNYGQAGNYSTGCMMDGAPANCSSVLHALQNESAWNCGSAGCGPQAVNGQFQFFNASSGTWSSSLTGTGGWTQGYGVVDARTGAGYYIRTWDREQRGRRGAGDILPLLNFLGTMDPQNPAHTADDLKKSIYDNQALLAKINDCLKSKLTPEQFKLVGEQTLANAPAIEASLTSQEIEAKYTHQSTYATWVPTGGSNGTIFIGSQFFNDPTQWTQSRPNLPGRTPLQNAYVHELGNRASLIASRGTTYLLFGAKPANGLVPTDPDSGYALQACVFNEQIQMRKP
jgi:YD repeat-containing protein